VVAISAFVGFESSTTLGGEARNPFSTVPRTLRWTPVAAAAIYIVAVPVQAVALYGAPDSVRSSSTPLVEVLLADNSRVLAAVLDLGIAASFLACTLASTNALVRVLFCMGREGVAPSIFGRAHRRFQTPAHAIVIVVVVIASLPIVLTLGGTTPEEGLRIFLTLSACGYIGSYLAGCVSTPLLLRRIGESTPSVWILSAVTSTVLAFLASTAVVVSVGSGDWLIAIYGAVMVGGCVYAVVLRRWAPETLARVGIYDETQRSDVLRVVTFR
jgi:amino acid transporter